MKRALPIPPSRLRLPLAPLGMATSLVLASTALALTTDNPYSAIASRNAFALKPPVVVTNTPTTPVVAPAGIELQGINTILGKAQVFLKIKLPARPPKPPEDQSVVLEAGQREGDVEVISIDAAAGVVRLKNRGDEMALNMKDNAATPVAAPIAAPPVPGLTLPRPAGLPAPAGVVPPARANAGGVSTTTIGAPSTVPTRAMRSNQPMTPAQDRAFRETQVALIEVERELHRDNPNYPPPPPTPVTPNPQAPGVPE
jgi:hypothetical protein